MEIQAVVKNAELQKVLKEHIETTTGKNVHGDVKLTQVAGSPSQMPGQFQSFEATCVISDEPAPALPTQPPTPYNIP